LPIRVIECDIPTHAPYNKGEEMRHRVLLHRHPELAVRCTTKSTIKCRTPRTSSCCSGSWRCKH